MYKDKEKQREANRLRQQRYKAKNNDSAVLAQKQVLEKASGLIVSPETGNAYSNAPLKVTPLVTPKEVTPTGDRKYYVNELSSIDTNEPRTEPNRQHYIVKRNAATRTRLAATPLAELIASKQFIPAWRQPLKKA